MPIAVGCPGCNAQYSVPEKFAGQRMKCKACGAVLTVPAAEAPLEDELQELPAPAPAKPAKPVSKPVSKPAPAKAAAPASTGYGLGDLLDEELPALPPVPCPKCGELVHAALKECNFCGAPMLTKKMAAAMRSSEESEGGHGHGGGHGGDKPKKKKKKKKASTPSGSIPTFTIVVVCLDLMISLLQGGIGVLTLPVLGTPEAQQLGAAFSFRAYTSIGIGVFGLVAAVTMLMKQPWASIVGYLAAACTAGNIIASVIMIGPMMHQLASAATKSSYAAGGMAGAIVAIVIRVGILIVYATAVKTYEEWVSGTSS